MKHRAFTEDGQTFVEIEETYGTEVCDFCGRRVKCYWFENKSLDVRARIGYDICRDCLKQKEAKQ